MNGIRFASVLIAICFMFSTGYALDKKPLQSEKESFLSKPDQQYQHALSLKDKGEYDAAIRILQNLVDENQGNVRYEIARLDAIIEQSRDLKEAGNAGWKIKAKEVRYRIKVMHAANAGNGDYWVLYAKYSWIVESNKETHITKAIEKALFYKHDNPEAYIVQADYYFDKAVNTSGDGRQNTMMQGISTNAEGDRFSYAKMAKASYESALKGNLRAARKAYIYYRMGSLEERIFQENASARKDWESAVKLSPESLAGRLARNRLGS